jgi:hypothetical protein
MANHEYYTGLSSSAACSLAISGQLSEQEGSDWIEHVGSCAECRQLTCNFMQVSFRLLSKDDALEGADRELVGTVQKTLEPAWSTVPVAEPDAEHVKQVPPRKSRLARVVFGMAVAASLVFAFTLGSTLGKRRGVPLPSSSRSQPASPGDNAVAVAGARALVAENERLTNQLQDAQSREGILIREWRKQTEDLTSAQATNTELKSRIAILEKSNAEFGNKELQHNVELLQARKELETSRGESDARQNAATTAQAELAERRAEVVRLSDQLHDAHRLIATLKQAQALVEGRKVHLWDVYDTDENGHRQQAYGRILYAERDGLVFYVYDLAQPENVNARISFYVWGEKAGTPQPVKNLGTLHIDDAKNKRWKLTFDDGNVLAQINSVFITAEPSRSAATKPKGKKILSARLDSRTDHP